MLPFLCVSSVLWLLSTEVKRRLNLPWWNMQPLPHHHHLFSGPHPLHSLSESLCLLLIRSHWGCSSSHFTFLSLWAAAGLLGLLFHWVSAIRGSSWIALLQKTMQPRLLFFQFTFSFVFSPPSSWWELCFRSWPMSKERNINYLEQGLVQFIVCIIMYVSHPCSSLPSTYPAPRILVLFLATHAMCLSGVISYVDRLTCAVDTALTND